MRAAMLDQLGCLAAGAGAEASRRTWSLRGNGKDENNNHADAVSFVLLTLSTAIDRARKDLPVL